MTDSTLQNAITVAIFALALVVVIALFRSLHLNTRFFDEVQEVVLGGLESSQFLAFQGAIALLLGAAFFLPREHPLLSVFALAFGIYGAACSGGSLAFWSAQGFYRGRDVWRRDKRDRDLREKVRADELSRRLGG